MRTDAQAKTCLQYWKVLAYPEDEKDGRPGRGLAASCCVVTQTVKPGETCRFEIVFSTEPNPAPGWELLARQARRLCARRPIS